VLTLLVTPSALMVRGNVRNWLDRRRARNTTMVAEPKTT